MAVMASEQQSGRVLMVVGTVVALLIGVAVVVAIQPPPVFDPSTPQGTAQGYFNAVLDDDDDLAFTYFSENLEERCDDDFRRYDRTGAGRVVITRTVTDGDRAELDGVSTVRHSSGPFSDGSYDVEVTLVMERHGDRWLITELPWPWDLYPCKWEPETESKG